MSKFNTVETISSCLFCLFCSQHNPKPNLNQSTPTLPNLSLPKPNLTLPNHQSTKSIPFLISTLFLVLTYGTYTLKYVRLIFQGIIMPEDFRSTKGFTSCYKSQNCYCTKKFHSSTKTNVFLNFEHFFGTAIILKRTEVKKLSNKKFLVYYEIKKVFHNIHDFYGSNFILNLIVFY